MKYAKYVILAVVVFLAGYLFATNPSADKVKTHMVLDGWIPTKTSSQNLLVCRIVRVNGLTGEKAVYLGIANRVIRVSGR